MLSHFPDFSPLELKHRAEFTKLTSKFEPYSDFNFTSLLGWNTDDSTEVSRLNNNIVVKMPDYKSGLPVVSIFGDDLIDESLSTLKINGVDELALVPEITIEAIQDYSTVEIEADRDNHDYVYILQDLVDLAGGKHKKKRNQINKIRHLYSDNIEVFSSTNLNSTNHQALEDVFRAWALNSRQSKDEIQPEAIAFRRLLEYAGNLALHVTTISIDKKPVAFSINEILENNFAICHFEKATPIHEAMPTLIAHEAAASLLQAGCKFVNWEQDLGIEGIRDTKNKFRPSSFLKKYTVLIK